MLYRQIILEWGQDTESGVWGLGYSPDNGKNFYVLNTTHGRKYRAEDGNRLYPYISDQIQDKIDTVVAPAKSAADSAQSAADAAVASAQVTSDAVSAIASATAEAKQGANDAMSRAKSAWDVAIGAKSAVTDFDPLLKSAQSDAGKALTQIADTANALSDAKTQFGSDVAAAKELANTAQTTADSAVAVASDASSNATVAIQTASGASLTATNAQGDATIAKQTASEAKVQASNAESDFAQLSIRANKIEANVANNSGAIASVQQTATGLTTTVAKLNARDGINLLQGTSATENEGPSDFSGIVVTAGDSYTFSGFMSSTSTSGIIAPYIQFYDGSGTKLKEFAKNSNVPVASGTSFVVTGVAPTNSVTARVLLAQSTGSITINYRSLKFEHGSQATPWTPAPTDASVAYNSLKVTVDQTSDIINDPKTGLNATYQTAAGNATTISNVKSDVAQLETTATGLTSRVGNLESKTNTQETAIEQNKNAIALKADQTAVDKINGTVSQLQSSLTVQAGQIQEKVTSSQVTGMLAGYATQAYTQSLVTQKANDWNLNLTSLRTDVNAIKTTGGGVNLAIGTSSKDQSAGDASQTTGWNIITIATFDNPQAGQQYTISVNTRNNGGSWRIQIWDGTSPTQRAKWITSGNNFTSTQEQKNTFTFTWPSGSNKYLIVQLGNGNNGGQISWNSAMLEEGTVAHTWSPAPSDMATVTSVTNLAIGVEGVQAQVYNSDGSSKITQLSNLIATKVSQGDYNSQITQLKNDINQRVQVGDVISQINQEAGGDTLIQVSNGKKSLILDAGNTVFTGKAWIPVAAIANLTADQIQAGTLSGSKVHAGDNSGNAIDMGALSTDYVGFHAYANNGDNTYIDLNGIHNYGASYDTRIQQGKITTNYLTVNGGGMIDFRDSNGTGMVAQGSTLTFDIGNTPAGYLSYNGMPVAEIPDGSGGNELAIRYGLSAAIIPNDNSGAQATFSGAAQKIGYMTGTNQGKQMLSGLEVHSNNHHWFGAVNSDATWNRIEINSNAGVNLAWHDQTHFWISDGKAKLYKDNNDSQTATELEVHGWAWVNGWVEAAGHSQHSTLSSKTRIEEADPDYMLDLVNNTDLTTFAFKSEVAEGLVVRHIGPIIDDVNDVAQYRTPAEFIAPTKTARDDDNMIGALFGAVQALTKRIKKLEDKLNE